MVAPYARNPVELIVTTELNSKPYVELTLAVMSDFGVEVTRQSYERFRHSACPLSTKAGLRRSNLTHRPPPIFLLPPPFWGVECV